MRLKKVLLIAWTFFLGMAVPTRINAQANSEFFTTTLHTTVTVYESGQSSVTHDFSIQNKTPTTYVSQYGLKLSSSELQNITVTSNGQRLQPEIVTLTAGNKNGPGQTSIGITFPDKIVGEGKTRTFTINYLHPDAATVIGSVLEVALPAQANPEDYDRYTVSLVTPAQFGPPTRTTPTDFAYTTKDNQIVTTFPDAERGIFAVYGNTQVFNLELKYTLENDTNNVGITQIALPPDTAHQSMHYHTLEPLPEKMELDPDGNWIATYELAAGSKTTVIASATAQLSLESNPHIPVPEPNSTLLAEREYWPVTHGTIKDLAKEYTTPEAINRYVVETLSYNTQRALEEPERLGTLQVLDDPTQAVCTEFTDVFVTMSRAAGIPARRITGYAYTENSELRPLSLVEDVLHAWPEYYDSNELQWIPIDPTWENTTGGVDYFNQVDVNHIVFAINGQDSSVPYPAGSYKDEVDQEKTISVTFGADFPNTLLDLEYKLLPKKVLGVALPGWYELHLSNLTGRAWYNLPITLTTTTTRIIGTKESGTIPTLLPFQTVVIPFRLEAHDGWLPTSDTIYVVNDQESTTFDVTSGPAITYFLQQPTTLVGVAVFCIVITLGTGSLLVLRRQRQRTVRR